jgi:hypothetical protein
VAPPDLCAAPGVRLRRGHPADDIGRATIVTELASPWGLPFYVADDLEGNRWTFAQARPTMS